MCSGQFCSSEKEKKRIIRNQIRKAKRKKSKEKVESSAKIDAMHLWPGA
jgi:hypothetical protein